jgi:hypothetical protein
LKGAWFVRGEQLLLLGPRNLDRRYI